MPLPESMEYDELQRTSITTYTKHYYIGTERIAGALGTMKNLGLLCEVVWPGDQSIITEMGTKTIEAGDALIADYLAFEKDLQLPEPYLYETYICGDLDHHPENYDAYWYHPDHLGSSNYITNLAGMVNQHMEYLPFGETLVEEHLNSYNSPYKFNAKEFDVETGWYYYGARYYNPKWSIWLSVDPASDLYPGWSPYAYTLQNPAKYIDPTGMVVEESQGPTDEWNKKADGTLEWISGKGGDETDYVNQLDEEGNVVRTDTYDVEMDVQGVSETSELDFVYNKRPGKRDVIRGRGGAIEPGFYTAFLPLPKIAWGGKLAKFLGWGGKTAKNLIPEGKLANHLFKGAGKLMDTPTNRALIQKISNGKPLVVDKFGKSWYRGVDATGKAIYSYTQNGIVKGAGYTNFNAKQLINHIITTVGIK